MLLLATELFEMQPLARPDDELESFEDNEALVSK